MRNCLTPNHIRYFPNLKLVPNILAIWNECRTILEYSLPTNVYSNCLWIGCLLSGCFPRSRKIEHFFKYFFYEVWRKHILFKTFISILQVKSPCQIESWFFKLIFGIDKKLKNVKMSNRIKREKKNMEDINLI